MKNIVSHPICDDDPDGRGKTMNKRVTVIGMNEVGLAAAADLTQRDFEVTLFNFGQGDEGLNGIHQEEGVYFNGEWVSFQKLLMMLKTPYLLRHSS